MPQPQDATRKQATTTRQATTPQPTPAPRQAAANRREPAPAPGAAPAQDGADRRTQLAADRTVFAAERTYAAWVQLGLGSLASGVGAKKLLEGVVPEWMVIGMGTLLVLFSAFCFAAAVWRQLRPGAPPPTPDVRRIPPAILITVNGLLAIVALATLLTVWFGETGGD